MKEANDGPAYRIAVSRGIPCEARNKVQAEAKRRQAEYQNSLEAQNKAEADEWAARLAEIKKDIALLDAED